MLLMSGLDDLEPMLEASQQTRQSGSGLQSEGMACGTPHDRSDFKILCCLSNGCECEAG